MAGLEFQNKKSGLLDGIAPNIKKLPILFNKILAEDLWVLHLEPGWVEAFLVRMKSIESNRSPS